LLIVISLLLLIRISLILSFNCLIVLSLLLIISSYFCILDFNTIISYEYRIDCFFNNSLLCSFCFIYSCIFIVAERFLLRLLSLLSTGNIVLLLLSLLE